MSRKSKRKGISPLVATVLLISIALTASFIIASWANLYIRGQTDEFGDQQASERECRLGGFRLAQDLTYEAGGDPDGDGQITGIVDNNGRVTLTGWGANIVYANGEASNGTVANSDNDVRPGAFFPITINDVQGTPDLVRITTQCEDVFLDVSDIENA